MRELNIRVKLYSGSNFRVEFPSEAWTGRVKKTEPSEGEVTAQSDFCLSGWRLVHEYYTGSASCSFRHSTYYCDDGGGTIMNCTTFMCIDAPEQECGDGIPLR